MQFGVDAGLFHVEVQGGEAFGDVWAVLIAAQQQGGRVALGKAQRFRDGRVDDNLEIGARRFALDGVGGVGLAGVELGGRIKDQIAAGGEAHDAKFVDVPVLGLAAHQAEGALGVLVGVCFNLVG